MKRTHSLTLRLFNIGLVCLLVAATARAAEPVRYKARPGSKVRIDGSANIHDWSMEGTIIAGWFEVPPGTTIDSSQAGIGGMSGDKLNATAEVSIPVDSMHSGKQGMDDVMQQAMDSKDHPRIIYKLTDMTLKQPHTAGTPFEFNTKGNLSINGVTKPVSMLVTVENADKNKLKIIGGPVDINMTDYKVPPPTKFGLFTTKPDVKISFTWIVGLPKLGPGQ
ncbi:MAG TPA: YceI family protein [Verrucomicrobiae bacterium]|nr:YceI family protein [Verrucomicrobiae bacterium]